MKKLTRRTLLKSTTELIASAVAIPNVIPSSALGRSGSIAPSERLTMGGIGIGREGLQYRPSEEVVTRLGFKKLMLETIISQTMSGMKEFNKLLEGKI